MNKVRAMLAAKTFPMRCLFCHHAVVQAGSNCKTCGTYQPKDERPRIARNLGVRPGKPFCLTPRVAPVFNAPRVAG